MLDPTTTYPMNGFTTGGLLLARPPTLAGSKPQAWRVYHEPSRQYFPIGDRQRFHKLQLGKAWIERLLDAHPELDWSAATPEQIVDQTLGFYHAFLDARNER